MALLLGDQRLLQISKLQKRAARAILKFDWVTPLHQLVCFKRLVDCLWKVKSIITIIILTYKALDNMTLDYITKLLTPMPQTHSLNLQSGETSALYVPFLRTILYSGAFISPAPRLWNSLPQAVQNSASLNETPSTMYSNLHKVRITPKSPP